MMIKNQRGDSLVQLIVVIGIMSVVTTGIMSIIGVQQKETTALSEKLAANEAVRVVSSYIENQTLCGTMFASTNLVNPSAIPFDATNIKTASYPIALKQIPGQGIVAGQRVSPNSGTLGLLPANGTLPGIQVIITSETTATLKLNFDQSALVRSIHNLTFSNIPILTTGPTTAKTITGCGSAVAGGMRWALLDIGALSVVKGSGIASVMNSGGPGGTNFKVLFTTPMPDKDYTVLLMARGPAGLSHGQWISEVSAGRSVYGFEFIGMNWGATKPEYGKPYFMNVMVIP